MSQPEPGFLDKIRVALISTKIRLWDNSIKLNFTKRKSDKNKKRGRKKQNISTSSLYCKGVESVYIDFKSADEKLRNIGSKPSSSRTDVSRYDSNEIEKNTLQYPKKIEVATIHTEEIQGFTNDSESKMADRNTSRFNVNRGAGNQARIEVKRRSRSAGPNGKTKQRNSVDEKRFMAAQEKKNKSSRHYQRKQQQTKTRHSMYNEPISDKEGFPDYLGSSSGSESDQGQKKWIKNPLNVKKAKKAQNDKRKSSSYDNADRANGKTSEIKFRNVTDSPDLPVRDYYKDISDRNYDNAGQKGKYQRLEELRKKRIDITVTSDEELNSPAYRISRLRQRALQGARGSLKLPDTLDEWDIINNKPRVPEKPRHLEIKREVKVADIPVENGSSSSEQISLRQIGPGLRTNQGNIRPTNLVHQPMQNIQVQGSYRKIPKQDSVFMNSQNVNNVEERNNGMNDTAPRLRELPSGGVVRYVNVKSGSHYAPNHETGNDKVISFNEVRTNEPVIPKKAIDRVDKKRKSHSDDSLDELIESNIQYLESEIESGKLQQISKMQPGFFPVDSVNNQGRDKRRSASWEGVTRDNNSFQNEVKLRLQIPSLMTSSAQRSPSPRGGNFESCSYSSPQPYRKVESLNQTSSSLPHQSDVQVVYKTHVFQNTVPKVERKMLSATHSPYLSRKPTELTEMEDLSKSDSQLSEHTFAYQRPSNYLHPNFRLIQTSSLKSNHEGRSDEMKNAILKSLSVPVMESGMFSDVDYDIEVSERIKKWEKLMEKKKSVGSSIDDGQQSLTTIIESECTLPEAWQREPETPVPIPQTMSFTSASVTVSRASSSVDNDNFLPHRPHSPVTVKTYFEPKVQSSENSVHRIFRVVQDPRCYKTISSGANEPELNWVQNPLLREKTPYDNRIEQDQNNFVTEESVLRPNVTSKQGWPPQNFVVDEKTQKPSRISRFEDELNELQDIKVETVSDLRRRFNSDASGNESTDVTETPATPVRMTPLRQRKQYAQVTTQPQPKKATEKKVLPPHVPPVKVFERKIDKISIAPQSSKSNDAEVWSPNLESKKGLVSIERVTARTLQTIPFSEDPIWREIEEMTNIDKLLASEDKELAETKSNTVVECSSSDNVPHSIQIKSAVKSQESNPSEARQNFFAAATAHQNISDPSAYQHLIKTRPFITPKIQPLKLSVNTKTSVDALDEVLEDIRNSLQKKSSVSETSSPMVKNRSFFPADSKNVQGDMASKNVVSSAYTHYDPSSYQSDRTDHHTVSEPISSDGAMFQQTQQQVIDPDFTQYGILKKIPPPPPERKHLPTFARSDSESTNAEEEVLRSMEELKKLAEDVEQKLRQIKTKIITSDEGNLDTIVTALRKFAPAVNPKFDPKKLETKDEHFAKKSKMKDALSELERIYDSLDLDDENLISRAERRETTLPRMTSHMASSQKTGLKRTVSDPDYTGSYGMWRSNNDDFHHFEDLDHVERETQQEFDCINKSFETLLAEVSQPVEFESTAKASESTKRDEHVAEINATLDDFLGKYRKNETDMYDSKYDPVKASDLVDQFKGNKPSVSSPSSQVSIPNRCRDVMKSEVFTATSGPFSVLVGINGNPRKTKSKVRKTAKKTTQNETVKPKSSSVGTSTVGVQNSSSNESGSKDESESESGRKSQITRRQKRAQHWQHRKSMPADMLKKSVETQTSDAHWVSPVAVIKEKFQNRNERDTSVSSENSDAQGPRKKQIAKGIAAMMEFFSSSEDERGRRTRISHSHSAPDLMELFTSDPKKSEKVSSPTSGRPLTPRTVKQRHEARARKRSIDIQNKTSEEKTDEFSVTSATSDDGQKHSKPPRHPGLRKQKSSSPDKSDTGKTDSSLDRKTDKSDSGKPDTGLDRITNDDEDKVPNSDQNTNVVLRNKASDAEERPRSFHELLSTFETNKDRLAKMKSSLRKCASADNVLEETVFRKSYSSEPDLYLNENRRRASDSGMKLNLEIKVKT
ncbi:hypothetical protein FSP39_010329 [Pinctada imbricata]|uniref:Uncharacterized protein n=1 Tax=Pinctada imbricata TaxID=66713 RepID=A0AA89BPQ5_PINIB|nr:hypothetical protein FSP39_010329 [Pinctada imbricata]